MPSTTTYAYFFAILAAGIVMLLLAFTLFLPVVMLAPSKFAITFTLGSLLIMSAFVSLKGWRGQLQHMLTRERLPFTIGQPHLLPYSFENPFLIGLVIMCR